MKRVGIGLWEQIIDIENIKYAHKQAKRGKSHYSEVKEFDKDVEAKCLAIRSMLVNKTFTTSKYEVSTIFDGRKERVVHKLPYYPDRIIHHALMSVVGKILYKNLIRDTFQSIQGRGTSDAARRVKKLVREKKPKYALKLDIRKYYPSVNNEILKQKIRNKIKCKDTLWLLYDIIDSLNGLPIGNYTSQILGNFYLSELDWIVKQHIRPTGYFRYCDDLVLFSNNKQYLIKAKYKIETLLHSLCLTLKQESHIYGVKNQGIDFVGYVFKHNTTLLRRSIKESFRDSCSHAYSTLSSIMAYKGWVVRSRAKTLWRRNTANLIYKYRKQLQRHI